MSDTIVNLNEAKEEAQRLSRVLRRSVEVAPVNHDCDYSKNCGVCAGEGIFYELRFGFCDHAVGDAEETECIENFCRERERVRSEFDTQDSFPVLHRGLKSCADVQSGMEAEVA